VIWRSAFALASPGGTRARLSVLIFHRVLPRRDPLFPGEISECSFFRQDKFVLLACRNTLGLYKYKLDDSKMDLQK